MTSACNSFDKFIANMVGDGNRSSRRDFDSSALIDWICFMRVFQDLFEPVGRQSRSLALLRLSFRLRGRRRFLDVARLAVIGLET